MHTASRTLVLMRHAKAESWAESDHDRHLTTRGRRAATAAGAVLAAAGFTPDVALVSSATRAQETWEDLARAAGFDGPPHVDRGLYDASPDAVLDLLREVRSDCRGVLVLGHNPTTAMLAQTLDDGEGDATATDALQRGLRTAGVAIFAVEDEWASLGLGGGRLVQVWSPEEEL